LPIDGILHHVTTYKSWGANLDVCKPLRAHPRPPCSLTFNTKQTLHLIKSNYIALITSMVLNCSRDCGYAVNIYIAVKCEQIQFMQLQNLKRSGRTSAKTHVNNEGPRRGFSWKGWKENRPKNRAMHEKELLGQLFSYMVMMKTITLAITKKGINQGIHFLKCFISLYSTMASTFEGKDLFISIELSKWREKKKKKPQYLNYFYGKIWSHSKTYKSGNNAMKLVMI